ncbi:uncharacterized protein LOC131287840 [Anopheles ziemanni]|uniref:uncharacterized protein LOC131272362 n=1 Tax=Anopheles coustani TaxID=139045 RepID=UPI00265A278B|nr:uncharacterized protein LOC131272362 [Anopheles coustani]XP_058172909.1 uncharacterized protein LOC131287840 [Anopheles ziemanni]
MCETTVHCLEVTNVQNIETFHHPIVLVKGKISNRCTNAKLEVFSQHHQPISYSATIEDGVKRESPGPVYFRVLLRLHVGQNDIVLAYCVGAKSLTLCYTAPSSRYTVVPLYIICAGHTGHYQSYDTDKENDSVIACRKITLAIELLQCLYAEKLHENGFGRKTFCVGSSCVPFRSSLELEHSTTMTEGELWQYFASELVQCREYDLKRVKIVAFLSSTRFEGISDGDYSYENIRKKTTGHAALGGGGLALFGTGCLYTWPTTLEAVCDAFSSQRPVDCDKLLDDSNYRRTYGGCYATTLGSVCHEMGHIFDLGHTPDSSIMGTGLDGIDNVFVGSSAATGPKRLIETRPHGPTGKLTQLKRPGDVFRERLESKCNDGIFFALNSAVTLNHHRWFNYSFANPDDNGSEMLHYAHSTRTITSTDSPIVLVEVRLTSNGMMQKFWTFPQAKCPASFTIPKLSTFVDRTLFAMNAVGCTLKMDLSSIN